MRWLLTFVTTSIFVSIHRCRLQNTSSSHCCFCFPFRCCYYHHFNYFYKCIPILIVPLLFQSIVYLLKLWSDEMMGDLENYIVAKLIKTTITEIRVVNDMNYCWNPNLKEEPETIWIIILLIISCL